VTVAAAATTLGIGAGNTGVLALGRAMTLLSAVPACIPVLARLGAVTDTMIETLTVRALENNLLVHAILGDFELAADTQVALLCPAVSLDPRMRRTGLYLRLHW